MLRALRIQMARAEVAWVVVIKSLPILSFEGVCRWSLGDAVRYITYRWERISKWRRCLHVERQKGMVDDDLDARIWLHIHNCSYIRSSSSSST